VDIDITRQRPESSRSLRRRRRMPTMNNQKVMMAGEAMPNAWVIPVRSPMYAWIAPEITLPTPLITATHPSQRG
jgi:hypothetical protein